MIAITLATQSKAWTVFAGSNTGIVGSNPTRGMDVCVRLFCVRVVLWVGCGLTTGWAPVQGVLPTVYSIKKLKRRPRSTRGVRAINKEIQKWSSAGHSTRVFLLHPVFTPFCCWLRLLAFKAYAAPATSEVEESHPPRFIKYEPLDILLTLLFPFIPFLFFLIFA
jgi:hypothetical protein